MIVLQADRHRAVVNPLGGSLAEFAWDGNDIVLPQDADGVAPRFRGAVLAPWPNRVHDGTYEFGGRTHALPINEPARRAALHGLVYDRDWRPVEQTADRVTLQVTIEPQDGYPFTLDLRVTYALGADGLTVTLRATNAGDHAAPYGCGFHPYLGTGPVPLDEVELRLDAESRLDVTPDRMLPVGISDVAGTPYDFTGGRLVGDRRLDDAYTGVGRVALERESVGTIELWRGDGLPWLQAFTPAERDSIALEPCSCPEDAFRSTTDLTVLEPGDEHVVTWGLTVSPSAR